MEEEKGLKAGRQRKQAGNRGTVCEGKRFHWLLDSVTEQPFGCCSIETENRLGCQGAGRQQTPTARHLPMLPSRETELCLATC